MTMLKPTLFTLTLAAGASWVAAAEAPPKNDAFSWPAVTRECRPWTRWWWLGSAVDAANLTRELTQFRDAGLGGVEICPIYGAKGYEDRFLPFLSPQWMAMLSHTTAEAKRLNLGVDLTTGTGWPFGGPSVTAPDASSSLVLKKYALTGGARLEEALPLGRPQCILAISGTGERRDVTEKAQADGTLDWTAPPGEWQLFVAVERGPVQKVKRAAPGGEGDVLDPYSVAALDRYLAVFDHAFADYKGEMPRAHFHDSFEYYGASWTPDFFREFQARRGYDLRAELPALFGEGADDRVARVKGDYRETISDLHLDYIRRWTEWSHLKHGLSRDQAHGSPGNILDLYAASDIPENEIFRSVDEQQLPRLKFSSSAAHLNGRNLASAESFTWLREHFQATLAQAKQAADFLFLSGVNHVFFHGIPYSPADAPWPGWQFYASVNFGPEGGLWQDLPAFNAYLTRCQSILQAGVSGNDILLYYPVHDVWNAGSDLIIQNPVPKPYLDAGMALWNRGYSYDAVSDRFLAQAQGDASRVLIGGNAYRTVLVPKCQRMPAATLEKLIELARGGATVLFEGGIPSDVPGWGDLENRRAAFRKTLATLSFEGPATTTLRRAAVGKGAVIVGDDLDALLHETSAIREPMAEIGLRFVRRSHASAGYNYFIVNRSPKTVDGWVALGTRATSAVLMDPRFEDRVGVVPLRQTASGTSEVALKLLPDESRVLRTFIRDQVKGPAWRDLVTVGQPVTLPGKWRVHFLSGGPVLPADMETAQLGSWTGTTDEEAKRFAGTARYTLEFDRPAGSASDWLLDLGDVRESARVRLNGEPLATLFTPPFQLAVGQALRAGKNVLEIDVTNLAANRVHDLDVRKVAWKYFYDSNVLNVSYRPLDASAWPLRDSGLLGPVTLTRLERRARAER